MKYNAEESWKEIYESDAEDWHTQYYSDVYDFAEAWDLPEKYAFVVRVFDRKKSKVKEKAFSDKRKAVNYLHKLSGSKHLEVAFYDDNGLRSNYSISDVS